MKSLVVSAVAFAALFACAPAMAQATNPASGTVNITATVDFTCTIGGMASAGLLDTANFSNAGSSTLLSTNHVNANLATGDCNTPTHITVQSGNGGATLGGGAVTWGNPASYENAFDYTATVTFDTATATLDTSTTNTFAGSESATSGSATSGPFNGAIGVTIAPATSGKKYQAGVYSDTLTITLTAN